MAQVGRLHGKVAIVTGASGAIGKAICERFLAEGDVAMIQCDVTEEKSVCEALSRSHSQFEQNCNILVNCAGIVIPSPIVETTTSSFNKVMGVNLNGVFNFTKEFILRLELGENKDVSGASIVNIASMAGRLGLKNCSAYAASKGGVIGFTKTTCIEVGKYGVRCNALTPAAIDTAMLTNDFDKAFLDAFKSTIPIGRFGKPVEVANACLFLASDESSYINGATLDISGGLMA